MDSVRHFRAKAFMRDGAVMLASVVALLAAACQPIQPEAARAAPAVEIDAKAFAKIEAARGAAGPSATLSRVLPQAAPEFDPGALELNPFLQTFPELRQAPAPEWLHEGVRVTYYVQSATYVADPREKDPSGAGYMQYDLVALDRRSAVASAKFILDSGDGVLTPSTVLPSYGIPGAGDYWIAPQALVHAEDAIGPNVAVVRMPTTLNGQTYAAVRFQSEDERATYVWMYEEATGLLLFHRYELRNVVGDTEQAGTVTFVAMRDLKLPWRATRVPTWAAKGAKLSYDGSYSTVIPGSPAIAMPYSLQAELRQAKRRWFEYELTDYLYGQPNSTSRRVNGVAQATDALWLPPRGLAALEVGQIIDDDPVTGFTTRVEEVRDDVVILRASGPRHDTWAAFDRGSGVLVSMTSSMQSGIATIQIEARLTGQTQ